MTTLQTLLVVAGITLIPTVSLLGLFISHKREENRIKVPIRIDSRRNRK